VRQPIYSRSVARWRHYESELDNLFRAIPVNADNPTARIIGDPGRHLLGLRSAQGSARQASKQVRTSEHVEVRRK